MCKCNGCGSYGEWKAFQSRNAALWTEAQTDPRDLSYTEALALAEARDDEERAQWEREEVGAFVARVAA